MHFEANTKFIELKTDKCILGGDGVSGIMRNTGELSIWPSAVTAVTMYVFPAVRDHRHVLLTHPFSLLTYSTRLFSQCSRLF